MPLLSHRKALKALKKSSAIDLYTDSVYVRDGITKWIHNWKRNGWRTAAKKPVKNVELWQALEAELENHDVVWHWVKGHAGNKGNERADALANRGMDAVRYG